MPSFSQPALTGYVCVYVFLGICGGCCGFLGVLADVFEDGEIEA